MMEKTKRNVPELRFPDYNNQWKDIKLGDIISNLESGVSVNSIDETINNISEFGILKTSCVAQGNFNPFENKRILDNEVSRARLNPVKDSILISRMNTLQLVGESGYVTMDYSNLFIPDRLWMITTDSNKVISRFLSIILSSSKLMTQISNIATGTSGSMKNISQPNFLNLQVVIPNISEQQKVSSFFTAIDDKLHTLKKKKTLLEQYKKGVTQKIFSQELRFNDENGNKYPEWKENSLKNNAKFYSGGTPLTTISQYYIGDIPFIKSGEINADKTEQCISEEGFKNSSSKMVEVGDILYALYGATSGEVGISKIKGAINQAVLCIKSNFITYYLYSYLCFTKQDIISKYLQGGQGNLSADIVKALIIPTPSLPEQTKIANFLSAIDEKINLCTTQIEKTEQYKKGLLQKMFV